MNLAVGGESQGGLETNSILVSTPSSRGSVGNIAAHHLDPAGNHLRTGDRNIYSPISRRLDGQRDIPRPLRPSSCPKRCEKTGRLFHPSLISDSPSRERSLVEPVVEKHILEGDILPEGPFVMERVHIPTWEVDGRIVYYFIEVTASDGFVYMTKRRYSEFHKFHTNNCGYFQKVCPANLPPKDPLKHTRLFQTFLCMIESESETEIRRRGLQKYLERLVRFARSTTTSDVQLQVGQMLNTFLEFYAYYAPCVMAESQSELSKIEFEEVARAPSGSYPGSPKDVAASLACKEDKGSNFQNERRSPRAAVCNGSQEMGVQEGSPEKMGKFVVGELVECPGHGVGFVTRVSTDGAHCTVALRTYLSSLAFDRAPTIYTKAEELRAARVEEPKLDSEVFSTSFGPGELEETEEGFLVVRLGPLYRSSLRFNGPPVLRFQGVLGGRKYASMHSRNGLVGRFVNCAGQGSGIITAISTDASQCIVELQNYTSSIIFDDHPRVQIEISRKI